MSESVNLPALGESVTEGTVTRWLKSVGDTVEVDEPLLEVSTDKVDTEIPSPIAGVVEEILVQEDETVEVGAALVRIGDGSGAGGDQAPAQAASQPEDAEPAPVDATPAPAPTQVAEQQPEFAPSAGASYTSPPPETEVAGGQAQQPPAPPQPSGGQQGGDTMVDQPLIPSSEAPLGWDGGGAPPPAGPPAPA